MSMHDYLHLKKMSVPDDAMKLKHKAESNGYKYKSDYKGGCLSFFILLIASSLSIAISSCNSRKSEELENSKIESIYASTQYKLLSKKVLKFSNESQLLQQRYNELQTDSILGKDTKGLDRVKRKLIEVERNFDSAIQERRYLLLVH